MPNKVCIYESPYTCIRDMKNILEIWTYLWVGHEGSDCCFESDNEIQIAFTSLNISMLYWYWKDITVMGLDVKIGNHKYFAFYYT